MPYVRRIAASGHEIASHGYAHQNIDTQTQAEFRDANKTLDAFDFDFNKKMNRRLDTSE